MATWVRTLSTTPNATDLPLSGTVEITDTAPADFDPDAVNSVRFQMTCSINTGTFVAPESQTVHNHALLTLDGIGTTVADSGDQTDDNLDDGTSSVSMDATDSTIATGFTTVQWEAMELNEGQTDWTTYNQDMGKDGVNILFSAVTITIDYTPAVVTAVYPPFPRRKLTTVRM